jgi:hypothetical protein
VRLQQIDGVHAEPSQAAFGGLGDVTCDQVVAAHLRRNENSLAGTRPRSKGAADQLFGRAICLGGVDQRHALLESMVERSDGIAIVDGAQAATDRPRTEANHRNRRAVAAELALLHVERSDCKIPTSAAALGFRPGRDGMGSRR